MTEQTDKDFYLLVDSNGNSFYGCFWKEDNVWFYGEQEGHFRAKEIQNNAVELIGDSTYRRYWEVPAPVYAKIDWDNLTVSTFTGHQLTMEYRQPPAQQ